MPDNVSRESRNEIFNQGGAAQMHPGIPTSNVMKDDFGFEIPVENVPLPSRGLIYETTSPLYNQETLEIKAMTAREEDILTSRALIRKGTVITALLQSCLINKNINVDEMLVGDRNAIMTAIRVTGYGSDYKAEIDCPNCSEKSKQEFSLTELPIKRLGINPVAPGINLFEYQLPATQKKVRFRFLTGADEREMMIIAERKKKSGMHTDALVTERLSRQLVSVSEIDDKNKIGFFIKNMPARDSLHLRQYIDKHEPGIDMKSWMECIHCGEHSEVRLPMGASFFWPDSQ